MKTLMKLALAGLIFASGYQVGKHNGHVQAAKNASEYEDYLNEQGKGMAK